MSDDAFTPSGFEYVLKKISSDVGRPFDVSDWQPFREKVAGAACSSFRLIPDRPNRWALSGRKRFFDVMCVMLGLPLLLPLVLVVGLAVRFTSRGPILFLQERMGRNGKVFTILKFRTMTHLTHAARTTVTTNNSQQFTPIGLFLRRWKLDELPQLLNVVLGDMSLVGARPKVREHQIGVLRCRPGITGAATLAFAREGATLACVPKLRLQDYYREVILPIKWRLDVEYMTRASISSDLKLIVNSVLRRWNYADLSRMCDWERSEEQRSRKSGGLCGGRIEKTASSPSCIVCLRASAEIERDSPWSDDCKFELKKTDTLRGQIPCP